MPRTILHLDLDAFFCAVEEIQNPSLRGVAFAVGGSPDQRGVVASCSYAARHKGVRSAMPMARALRLCPELIIVSHRHHFYGEVSEQVMAQLHKLSPLVEQISIDEAFIDISDLPGSPENIAGRLQSQIRSELSLPCSIGIASNKLVAKIATEVGKKSAVGNAPPCAITIVPPGRESEFLSPLPASMLWGVGPKTEARLAELGIHTIGDIAAWPENDLAHRWGENGRDLHRRALGIDDRPISTEREAKSISQETTFSRDVRDDHELEKTLRQLAEQVGYQLRENELAGRTIRLKLRWPDFTTLTRQITLQSPTDNDGVISEAAIKLMKTVRRSNQYVRLIGVGVSGLGRPVRQLGLWDADAQKAQRLQSAVDELREKFGRRIIHHGDRP